MKTPEIIVPYVNNYVNYILALIATVIIFVSVNPFIGLLFGISFYLLFYRTSNVFSVESVKEDTLHSLTKIGKDLSIPLKFPTNARGEVIQTRDDSNILEVEMVDKMVRPNETPILGDSSYEPVQAGGVASSNL